MYLYLPGKLGKGLAAIYLHGSVACSGYLTAVVVEIAQLKWFYPVKHTAVIALHKGDITLSRDFPAEYMLGEYRLGCFITVQKQYAPAILLIFAQGLRIVVIKHMRVAYDGHCGICSKHLGNGSISCIFDTERRKCGGSLIGALPFEYGKSLLAVSYFIAFGPVAGGKQQLILIGRHGYAVFIKFQIQACLDLLLGQTLRDGNLRVNPQTSVVWHTVKHSVAMVKHPAALVAKFPTQKCGPQSTPLLQVVYHTDACGKFFAGIQMASPQLGAYKHRLESSGQRVICRPRLDAVGVVNLSEPCEQGEMHDT